MGSSAMDGVFPTINFDQMLFSDGGTTLNMDWFSVIKFWK